MSTDTFSSQNTLPLTETILRFFSPELSSQEIGPVHLYIRKVAHAVEYFVLSLMLFRAFRADSATSWNWRWSLSAIVGVAGWAVCDELHQSFVASRAASAMDVGIDTAGGLFAQLLNGLWHRQWYSQ